MVDPDKSSASSGFVYTSTIVLAIFVALMIIVLYSQYTTLSLKVNYSIIIWFVIPLLITILSFGINMFGQYTACKKTNPGNAAMSTLPVLGFIYLALGLSHISYIRAPIASLFVQLPDVTLLQAEKERPVFKGIAISYYVFFGMLFGQVIASGLSQIC
jgi:hypothetical protein